MSREDDTLSADNAARDELLARLSAHEMMRIMPYRASLSVIGDESVR